MSGQPTDRPPFALPLGVHRQRRRGPAWALAGSANVRLAGTRTRQTTGPLTIEAVKGNTVKKNLVTVIGLPFSVLAIALALVAMARADQQGPGSTPSPPPVTTTVMATPTPTPGPVNSTGGASGGSNPGNSCSVRLGTRNAPPTPSPITSWTTNGDVGWPFGWTGGGVYAAVPTTAPNMGCSR